MRLKSKFSLIALAAAGAPVLAAGLIFIAASTTEDYVQRLERIDQIVTACFDISRIVDMRTRHAEYEDPAKWKHTTRMLLDGTAELMPANESEWHALDQVRTHHQRVASLLADLDALRAEYETAAGTNSAGINTAAEDEILTDLMPTVNALVALSNELKTNAYADLAQFRKVFDVSILAFICLVALATSGVVVWGGRRMMRRIDTVRAGMRAVAEGNLEHEMALTSNDELGEMAREFDKMTARLRTTLAEEKRLLQEVKVHELVADEIHRNQDMTRRWLNSCTDGVWDWYIDSEYEYMSPRFWELFGYDPDTRKSHPSEWKRLVFDEDLLRFEEAYRDHVKSHGVVPFRQELRFHHQDGDTVWVMCRGEVTEWNEDGSPKRMVGTHMDITRMKEAEKDLREAHQLLYAVVNQSPDSIFIKDLDGRYQLMNESGAKRHNKTVAEIIGRTTRDLFPAEVADKIVRDDNRIAESGSSNTFEQTLSYDSRETIMLTSKVSLLDARGAPIGLIGMSRDITELSKAREKLVQRSEALEQSNRELEQFAYVASHDLQEPLRKICAFGDLLQKLVGDTLPGEGVQYLEFMQSAARRMQTLIRDLLNLSRISTSAQSVQTVDLKALAEDVLIDLELAVEESGGKVVINALPVLEADPRQMRQLLQNLLGNALKFRQEEVPLTVEAVTETPDEDGMCRFSIRDNGIGFDAKFNERIFGAFQRLHSKQEYQGSGIGLAICRKIAERHNGDITVDSQPGRGTTFTVTLPLKQPEPESLD